MIKHESSTFFYGEDLLTAGKAIAICQNLSKGALSTETRKKVKKSASIVDNIASGKEAVYGINTGFGPLCTTMISEKDTKLLQYNILKSHSVGVGKPVPNEIAKLMMILKVHALAKAHSGISEEVLDRIIWHIDHDVVPIVPEQGSVGASGDLAPLSHLFLPLIGLGKVNYRGEIISTELLFEKTGLHPLTLGPKDGLALINGTQFIAAYAVKIVQKLHNCLSHADISGAMMLESLLSSVKPFAAKLHNLRPFKGIQHVAMRISNLIKDSEILDSHANCSKVQDPYSIRCMPQVHGASRNAWLHLKEILEIELNSVTDNPVIFDDASTISGGNFHGQPIALPLDYACLAAAELGNIADRRIYLSLEGKTENVPKLLMNDTGTNSGFMILQYTTAALVSENKSLCFPASADSIPTSLGQEDHVSMGSISGRKTLQVVENVEKILGIELLCAAQAFDFHKPLKSGVIMDAVHDFVRTKISHADSDRIFAHDMEKAIELVREGQILKTATASAERQGLPYHTIYDSIFESY